MPASTHTDWSAVDDFQSRRALVAYYDMAAQEAKDGLHAVESGSSGLSTQQLIGLAALTAAQNYAVLRALLLTTPLPEKPAGLLISTVLSRNETASLAEMHELAASGHDADGNPDQARCSRERAEQLRALVLRVNQ